MTSPLFLSKPVTREMLSLHLIVSESAASGSLVREDEGVQKPVYYVSRSLTGAQTRYQRMKKLALALYVTSRKLRHYFQSFSITILIEHPLRSITETPEATWRITKWTSELNPYSVKYEPRTMING